MKLILIIAVALLSLASCAQNKQQNMKDTLNTEEVHVLAVVRQLSELMIKGDTAAMNHILDGGYTLTHMTGYVQPKAEWFDAVINGSMKYYSANEVRHSVTVSGNKATVTMQNLVDARIWGSRNTWRLQQKMALEKRNGKWILLNAIASTF